MRCGPLWSTPIRGAFECTDLLSFAQGNASLGYGAACFWKDNVTLTVTMGTEATLVPGDFISILPFKIRSGLQLSYYLPTTPMANPRSLILNPKP